MLGIETAVTLVVGIVALIVVILAKRPTHVDELGSVLSEPKDSCGRLAVLDC